MLNYTLMPRDFLGAASYRYRKYLCFCGHLRKPNLRCSTQDNAQGMRLLLLHVRVASTVDVNLVHAHDLVPFDAEPWHGVKYKVTPSPSWTRLTRDSTHIRPAGDDRS